ncbi:glycosyltransferase [Patescibacteria group bacterium]|nr:glycosyltransferase [Patescibacteria group bacterium]
MAVKKTLSSYLPTIIKKLIERPIKNYYKTNYKKTVLISYITKPFTMNNLSLRHTNYAESLMIAEVFKELEYNIDVYSYNYEGKIDYSKYSLVFGFGDPLCNSFYNRTNRIITIYYGTGMHICMQNNNSIKRIKEVYEKMGVWLPESGRIVEKAWSIQTTLPDAMVVLGNQYTVESYKEYYKGPIFNIPISYIDIIPQKTIAQIINDKKYNETKFNFLWFSGPGLIHKGLDLLLEVFEKNANWHLHICADFNKEKNFEKLYYEQLYNLPNVKYYGFVDLKSKIFEKLMKECLFCILPSCAEGGGGSVINVMAEGLIPVVTKETSVDINNFGYLINGLNIIEINKTIRSILAEDENVLKQKSLECFFDTRERHSLEKYKQELKNSIKAILNDTKV